MTSEAGVLSRDNEQNAICWTPLTVRPRRVVFTIVFILVFCLSGFLTILSIGLTGSEYYRMGLVSLLVLPLLILYGVKTDSVFLTYGALAVITLLSGLSSRSSLREIILFMRILVFSYLIYRLVDLYVRPTNFQRILRWCIAVAVVQLPVLLLQRCLYEQFPQWLRARVGPTDISFGTFNFKGDAPMTFFLVLLIILLLFDTKGRFAIRFRWPLILWMTLTVLLANAELVKLIVAFVWAAYFIVQFRIKTMLYSTLAVTVLLGTLAAVGYLGPVYERLTYSLGANISATSGAQDRFLQGNYGRGAAIAYYLSRGPSLLGDGPSAYYDPVNRSRMLGNTGHIFTFYSEVGLLGWLGSVTVFLLIAFPRRGGRRRLTWVSLLCFAAVQLLTLTTECMNDISVMLAYTLTLRLYTINSEGSHL